MCVCIKAFLIQRYRKLSPPHRNQQLSDLCQQLQHRLEADMRYALTHRQRIRADGTEPEGHSFLLL